MLIVTSEKVATPLTAATAIVPVTVALRALGTNCTLMVLVALVTVFPAASSSATLKAGITTLPIARVGCTVNASFTGALGGAVVSLQAITRIVATAGRNREKREAKADAGRMEPPSPEDAHIMGEACADVKRIS